MVVGRGRNRHELAKVKIAHIPGNFSFVCIGHVCVLAHML